MNFNRNRFKKRQQARQHQQAQQHQNALLACVLLKSVGMSVQVENGVIIIFSDPQLVKLLYCLSHEFFTTKTELYSEPLQNFMKFFDAQPDMTGGFETLLTAIYLSRFYLRGWDKITKAYDRGSITIEKTFKWENFKP